MSLRHWFVAARCLTCANIKLRLCSVNCVGLQLDGIRADKGDYCPLFAYYFEVMTSELNGKMLQPHGRNVCLVGVRVTL
jgi:hypothetical protein